MASSSSQTSLDRNPWISMRHAFHSLQHPRFTRSFRRKRFWEKKTVAGERSVTVPNVWPKSPFQSNDRISSVLSVSSVLVQSSSPSLNKDHAVECPVCMQFLPAECFFSLQTCQHRSCLSCLKMYVRIEITEGRIEISCPECPVKFHPGDIRTILNDDSLMQKYEEFMLRHVLVLDPDTRWCPAPDCSYAVIANGCASCPQLTCERPGCGTLFCYHCKQRWHPNQTCDTARAERLDIQSSLSPDLSSDHGSQGTIKSCPRCGSLIMKLDDGSCNHMTCVGCGAEFCWLCLKEISDLHYLSPSGCTFWGKKPWSRKRRILWQLGMLIGAPVGISIIAGVSFPVIIIGLPILVGRKLMAKCRHMAKRKRHLVVVSGVIASALVSPVLAAIAVGAGVPMLLACVYGVVPVSLCRDSCCSGRHSNQDSEFEIDFKSLQDDQKGSPIVTSAVAPVGDTPSKTWSSENFSFQNQSLTTRVEVVAEVSCNEDRFAVDDRLKEYSDDAVGVRRTLAFAGTGVDSDKASDNQGELSKSCLVRFSDSDGSVYAAHPRSCSLSASAVVAESTGANSSSSSSESVRPFHHGKKLFPDGGSDVHGGAAYDTACHTVKSLKRQCMSVGDSIDERAKVERGYLSLHSLAEEESCLESFAGGSDIVAMVAVSEENPTADSHHAKPRAIRSSTSVAGALVTEMNGRCQAEKLSSMTEAKGPAEKRRSSCRTTRVLFAEDYSSK